MNVDRVADWFGENLGWILLALIAFIIVITCGAASHNIAMGERFMADCMKERKEYECTAMWRAGESRETMVPVVIPVGR